MAGPDVVLAVASTHGASAVALASLSFVGVLGVTDWILGEDDEEPEERSTDGGSIFDEEPVADDAGGGGDEFAFDDAGGGGEGGDAFDDFDMGGMDGDEPATGGVADLDRRVDEIEEELANLSSTVSTVRTENEQIGESVEDIEENVRKLLDIYKMVTKGVNPFVDQEGGDSFSAVDGNTLGLFDEEGDDEPADADLEEDVAEADAEEFFDDDFEDGDAEDFDDVEDTEEDQDMAQSEDDDGGGAKSFDELREEYEEGADWNDEDEAEEADAEEEDAKSVDPEADDPGDAEDESLDEDDATEDDSSAEEERVDGLFEEDDEASTAADVDPEPEPEPAYGPEHARPPRDAADPRAHGAHPGAYYQPRHPPQHQARPTSGGEPERPYLRDVPGGYVSDLLVMEWVEYLVTESSVDGAHRAITYYENVEWVGRHAADHLRAFVDGHPEARANVEEDEPLTMDHHTESLRYIARLNGDVQENVLNAWAEGDNTWLHQR